MNGDEPADLREVRQSVKVWLGWLGAVSLYDGGHLLFGGDDLLSASRWSWVGSINSHEDFWGMLFFALAMFSLLAVFVGGYVHARIALALSIPLHLIFGLSIAARTLALGATGPGLNFSKWFTTCVISSYLLTRPVGAKIKGD